MWQQQRPSHCNHRSDRATATTAAAAAAVCADLSSCLPCLSCLSRSVPYLRICATIVAVVIIITVILADTGLPATVLNETWDIIVVDAPPGVGSGAGARALAFWGRILSIDWLARFADPGRMGAIWVSSLLAHHIAALAPPGKPRAGGVEVLVRHTSDVSPETNDGYA